MARVTVANCARPLEDLGSGSRYLTLLYFGQLSLEMFSRSICLNNSDLKGCFLGQGFEEFEGTLPAQVGFCVKGLDGKSFFFG